MDDGDSDFPSFQQQQQQEEEEEEEEEEKGGEGRGKDRPTMRRRQASFLRKGLAACAKKSKPTLTIFGSLGLVLGVFYFASPSDGGATMNVSSIPLPFGDVRGKITESYGEYLGIPYAMPPRRFEAAKPWDDKFAGGFLDATHPPPACAQLVNGRVFGEEDCLFLNVYTPTKEEEEVEAKKKTKKEAKVVGEEAPTPAAAESHEKRSRRLAHAEKGGEIEEHEVEEVVTKPPRAVMVYFHGGGFASGAPTEVDGRQLAADNNVVVVTVAYRLGPLGFLAHAEMEEGQGNLGLLDQSTALQWIAAHIQAFNGDPSRITVLGHGAGGTSACLQALLPRNKDLALKTAIVESGACHASPLPQALARSTAFQQATNCSSLHCMRELPTDSLFLASKALSPQLNPAATYRFWQPVVDGIILPAPASELLAAAAGTTTGLAMIVGANTNEGAALVGSPALAGHAIETNEEYVAFVKGPLRELEDLEGLTDADLDVLLTFYPPSAQEEGGNQAMLATMLTDAHYRCPALYAAKLLAPHSFAYLFKYTDKEEEKEKDTGCGPTHPPALRGYGGSALTNDTASHAAEVPYVFHDGRLRTACPRAFNEAEDRLAHELQAYWTTFATMGLSPNPPPPTAVALPPPPPEALPVDDGVGDKKSWGFGRWGGNGREKEEEAAEEALDKERRQEAKPSEWPPYETGEGEQILVVSTPTHVAVEAPERMDVCAWWEQTQVFR